MFNAALNSTRHIELFVEYSSVGNALIPPIVDHGVGSSTRFEPMSIDCGMNEQTDVADVGLNTQENVQEHADVDVVRGDLADPELSSSSSDDILSDDSETGDSWEWFLDHVRIHVVQYEREVCIISDRHKGILKAMRSDEWKKPPICHHKFCLIHVRKNILTKLKGKGGKAKGMIWALGVTTQVRKYVRRRRALREESLIAIHELNKAKKENWSLCYDDELRWGVPSTNMSESYNNVLRGVRELPIRALVDLTFWRTVEWWADRKTEIQQTEGRLTPWARDKLVANDAKGQMHYCSVVARELGHYQIRSRPRVENGKSKGDNRQDVEFMDSKCSCGKWQMWRVPCSHACTVARDRGNSIFELIDKHNHKATWEAQYYGVSFQAPRHQDYWANPGWKLRITPEQLLPRKRGRGRTRRIPNKMDIREEDEPRAPRKCRNCGVEGHDRRNCTVGRVM
ncbi:uncharacterized protein LOC121779085 [Salvia splendens]|uniref:uncharacterized protein LOC121779085 n=1 Tax=Salvia splendens TaxID=180675 RepID=UPI001C27B1E5|nr:uncharacterized protein LOC121779085 [Salvia splendens]